MITDSGGDALSGRQEGETHLAEVTLAAVALFVAGARGAALAGTLSGVWVLSNWETVIETVAKVSPQAAELLRDSPIPAQVLTAALTAVSAARALGLNSSQAHEYVSTALGLSKDPAPGSGGEFGRILGVDGAFNWRASSASSARTAATGEFGASMLQQLRREGYTHKRWMTRYDSRVRDTHADVDRETIPLDEDFIVGGVALRYPGDPSAADFSEIVNCRCVLFGVNPTRRPWDVPEGTEPWNNPYPGP